MNNEDSSAPERPTAGEGLNLSADRPITRKAEDRLGRAPFAARLAAAIGSWTGAESLVLGLYGSWGSGKSSVKNLMLEALSESKRSAPHVLEFNPWQWRGHDEVSAAFFREVLRILGRPDQTGRALKLAKVLRRYARLLSIGGVFFDGIRVALGAAIGIVGLFGVGLPAVLTSKAAATWGQVLWAAIIAMAAILIWGEKVLDRISAWMEARSDAERKSLEEQKQAVASELRQHPKPLLVVIDDIDRLSASEIGAVFQLIKANADFPHFIYVVLFQRSIVERALQEEAEDDGSKFLEKIVQVGFDLPAARQEDIDKILFGGLDALLGKDRENIDQTYWGNVYYGTLRRYFSNLRNVKRFLNVFSFHLGLLRLNDVLEVNPVDLIALETLSLFEPALYQELLASKAMLTGRSEHEARNRAEFLEECGAILQCVPEERRESLRDLMRELFPPVADAFGGMHHGSDFYGAWLGDLRACSPEIFDRYFQHSLSPGDVSQAEIRRLVDLSSNGHELTRELRRLAADGRLVIALERLEVKLDTIDPKHFADVLIALFNAGEELPHSGSGSFDLPPHWTVMRLATQLLLREQDAERREQLLERAIRETDSISMAVLRIARDSDPEGRKTHPDKILVREGSLARFQALCVDRIRKARDEGRLYGQRGLAHILFRWRDWTSSDEVRDWVAKLVSSQHGAIIFLKAFLQSGTSQGSGDRVAKIHWYIKLKDTENFAASEQIEKSLGDVSLVTLSETDRRAVEKFREALARKRAGKVEGDFGWE